MKKLALILTIVLGITIGASAQTGGLFSKGPSNDADNEYNNRGGGLLLPGQHGSANDEAAPLGSGALLLIGFGAAYAMKKRNEK